jgi:pimeloyl-ACP methyl ester carboxylesterase
MYLPRQLQILGHQDEPLLHRFLQREEETDHAVLILPGGDVFAQSPALYYASLECMHRGADILWVGYNARPQFDALSLEEKGVWALHDSIAAYQTLLQQRAYQRLTLIAKSLGTLVLGHLLTDLPPKMPVQAIWLTPLINRQPLRAQMYQAAQPSLFVIGTQDPFFDAASAQEMQERSTEYGQLLLIEGADHGLEVGADGTDTLGSLQVLEQVMRAIQAFLR